MDLVTGNWSISEFETGLMQKNSDIPDLMPIISLNHSLHASAFLAAFLKVGLVNW